MTKSKTTIQKLRSSKRSRTRRAPHPATWQLQEAKNRLSEVVQFSISEGPQTITLHGKPSAVVVSMESFHKLSTGGEPLVDFLLNGLKDANLVLDREKFPVEELDL